MNHHLCYASVSEWGTAYQVDNAGQGRPYLLPYQVSKSGFATLAEIERRVRASFIDDNHDAHHLDMVIGAYYADDAPTRTQVEADAVRVYVALSRYIANLNNNNAPRAALLAVPSSLVLLTADTLSSAFLEQWDSE